MQSVICPKIQIKTDRERSVLILLIESAVSEQSDGIAAFVASVLRAEFTQDANPRQQQGEKTRDQNKRPEFLFGSCGGKCISKKQKLLCKRNEGM
ncbi:MAG: hypothetical protein ACLUE6_06145 [Acutalibacteraceae bacterium]